MKKIIIATLMLLGVSAFAGTMGEDKPLPVLIPFFDGEAAYTSPQVKGFYAQINNVGTLEGRQDRQGWGGRFAAGALHPFTERWSGSVEMGYGYYGSVKFVPTLFLNSGLAIAPTGNALKMKLNQYGLDVMAGVYYMQPKYELFFKAGALIQNMRVATSMVPQQLFSGSTSTLAQHFNGTYRINFAIANALPALRIGGGYRLSEQWMATVSWLHAFGSTLDLQMPNANRTSSSGEGILALGNITSQVHVPTIDTVLFGFDYRFNS